MVDGMACGFESIALFTHLYGHLALDILEDRLKDKLDPEEKDKQVHVMKKTMEILSWRMQMIEQNNE